MHSPADLASPERPLPPPVTYDEFLAWADEDTHAEWVDGRIVLLAHNSIGHQCLPGQHLPLRGPARPWLRPAWLRQRPRPPLADLAGLAGA